MKYGASDTLEEVEEEYIVEDQDTESSQIHKKARHVQQNILHELQTVVGGAQTLPETVAQDLILQVHIYFYIAIETL